MAGRAVVAGAGGVESWPVDVDRPAAARVAMPYGAVGAEIVLREDAQREHVTGVEGQAENAPALHVFVAGPPRVAAHHRKIRQLSRQADGGPAWHGLTSCTWVLAGS